MSLRISATPRRTGAAIIAVTALMVSVAACGSGSGGVANTSDDLPTVAPGKTEGFLPLLDEGSGDPDPAIVRGAEEEGALVWYDSSTREQADQIMSAFQKKYPFIKKVSHVQLVAGDITTRVAQESQSGRPSADVVSNSADLMAPLREKDLIAPLTADELGTPSELVINNLVVTSTTAYGIQYNTKLVDPDDVPQSWDDLLDPRWKGKIGLWALSAPINNLVPTWGSDKAVKYTEDLMANGPQVFQDVFAMTSAIASGQLAVGIGVDRITEIQKAKGAPTEFKAVDPLSVSALYSAGVKGAAHPNAAKLFISWLDSEEGAKAQEDATGRGNPQIPGTKVRTKYEGKNLSGWAPGDVEAYGAWGKQLSNIIAGK